MTEKLIKQLQNSYNNIRKIESINGSLIIYADDDTLWMILEDLRDEFNLEFEAGSSEDHFIRIII
jgi:hypothetical protein